MDLKSVIVGVILGVVLVAGPLGAMAAIDESNSVDTPDLTVERLNNTHASVAWATEEPARGHLETFVQPECGSSWIGVNDINASFGRIHTVVAPIYKLNRTQTNRTLTNLSDEDWFEYDGEPPKRFKVVAAVYKGGSGASKTVLTRNLSSSCQ